MKRHFIHFWKKCDITASQITVHFRIPLSGHAACSQASGEAATYLSPAGRLYAMHDDLKQISTPFETEMTFQVVLSTTTCTPDDVSTSPTTRTNGWTCMHSKLVEFIPSSLKFLCCLNKKPRFNLNRKKLWQLCSVEVHKHIKSDNACQSVLEIALIQLTCLPFRHGCNEQFFSLHWEH